MSTWPQRPGLNPLSRDRRQFPRHAVKSLAYADVGGGKGGIILNMSEGGLAIHSAVALGLLPISSVRFQLPDSFAWVTARGQIAWIGPSKKEAGIQLFDLPEQARSEIREWIISHVPSGAAPQQAQHAASQQIAPSLDAGDSLAPADVSKSTAFESEALDRALRSHFALRDRVGARRNSRSTERMWWGLIGLVAVLAVVSFSLGWATGRENWDRAVALFEKVSGRAAAVVQMKASNPSVNAAAVLPATVSPRFDITSTFLVPIAEPSGRKRPGKESVEVGHLERRVDPLYPADALTHDIEGTVHLRASVGEDGAIHEVSVVSGPPLLAPSAENAVRSWRYSPTMLDGKPVATQEDISIVFSLAPPAPPHHHP